MSAARPILLCVLGLSSAANSQQESVPADREGVEFFEREVRPILAARCYPCHSAQAEKLRGRLYLDSKAGWMRGGESGPVIAPGEPEKSPLVKAIRYGDETLQMPPKGRLPLKEIEALTRWVKMGAPDPRAGDAAAAPRPRTVDIEKGKEFWSFQPLRSAQLPQPKASKPCPNPVDAFVQAKLHEKGLSLNPPTDRRKIIRRAFFDLVGLPPSPEEVEAFVRDPRPEAYEELVDRLLASPSFGERWARHWLDAVRFAESHGFEHDFDRLFAFPYRDFVIKALNEDLPYDTFVRWQIAGDEFEPGNLEALAATGFLAAGVHSTQITANQVEKERYDEMDDMLRTIGTSMLGITIGCARCHDHKFDPFPNRDYYRLLSTFTATVRSDMKKDLDPEGYREAKAKFDQEHAPLVAALREYEQSDLPKRLEAWLAEPTRKIARPKWIVLDLVETQSAGKAEFSKLADGSVLAGGKNPKDDTYTLVAHTRLRGITAVRLEALTHESMIEGGPGRGDNGNFVLTDFRLKAAPLNAKEKPTPVKLVQPRASVEPYGYPSGAAIDENQESGWGGAAPFGRDHAAVFNTQSDLGFDGGTVLTFTLKFVINPRHTIGRPRLSVTPAPRPTGPEGEALPEDFLAALDEIDAGADVSGDRRSALERGFRFLDPGWRALNESVRNHLRTAPRPNVVTMLISGEGIPAVRLGTQGADFLKETHFLKRGDPNQKEGVASPGFLQVLMRAPDGEKRWHVEPPAGSRTSYRRRALAEWVTDVDRGAGALLARVIANRLWHHHFGRGIVATPGDFGAQGERPTHPELLEWLAAEVVRNGWRLKPIHRLILTSAAYRQSSRVDPDKSAADPTNQFLWRTPRRRLEAEAIRDAMLAASGTLESRLYGTGTLDPAHRRRSIYFTVKRSQLIPMMAAFDAPDGLQGIDRRPVTVVASQALYFLNSPLVRTYAEGFARRVASRATGSPAEAVRVAYAIALGRPPSGQELADGLEFIGDQAAAHTEASALVDFCQTLLGLSEFIYVD